MKAGRADAQARRASLTIAALSLGTTLNPLNSSMIAVALLALQRDFALSVAQVTWVITAFYIASIVGQPLMGRVIDAFGARRIFLAGMVLVVVAGAIAPLGGYGLVLVARVVMAIGTSVAYPAAVALVGPLAAAGGVSPPRLLARIQIANTTAAALGPVVGGLLIAFAGWPAIFLVNIPLALAALVAAAALAPRDAPHPRVTPALLVRTLDPVGVAAFAVAAVALLLVALRAAGTVGGPVLVVGLVALAGFVWWETRARTPFVDVRMLAANRALTLSYVAFGVFSALYYLAFFGLPQFLEAHGGYSTAVVGLLMLPLSGTTILFAPVVARWIERRGLAPVMLATGAMLLVAALALGLGILTTAPGWMVVMAAFMGLPYCMGSLALTEAVRRTAPRGGIGVATGLQQSMRYTGAIAATVVLGLVFAGGVDASSWAGVVAAAVGIGVVHLGVTVVAASAVRRR